MTSRDRPTPLNKSTPHRPGSPGGPLWSLLRDLADRPSLLEKWFHQAGSDQRQQVLELASQQGLIYAQQLPTPDGHPETESACVPLTAILAGRDSSLPPVVPDGGLHPVDLALDADQRQAVSRALSSPDVSLVLGYPGSGRSRVVTEILRQARRRNLRVLFIAPEPPALDRVLGTLGDDPDLSIVRWPEGTSRDQRPGSGKVPSLHDRLRRFEEQTLPAARQAVAALEKTRSAAAADAGVWDTLGRLATEGAVLAESVRQAEDESAGLDAALEAELTGEGTTEFARLWEGTVREAVGRLSALEVQLTRVRADVAGIEEARQHLLDEQHHLVPLAEARQAHRWWTGAYWRATLQGNPEPRLVEVGNRLRELDAQVEALREEENRLGLEKETLLAERERSREGLLAGERARRQAGLDAQLTGAREQLAKLESRWSEVCRQLALPAVPAERTPQGVEAARAVWRQRHEELERDLRLRRQWLSTLEELRPRLATELVGAAHLVAATADSLIPPPGEPVRPAVPVFDLLVLEDAHKVTEAELLAAARHARRCVLVGERTPELPAAASPRRSGTDRPRPVLPVQPLTRLWASLHADPRRLPACWTCSGGRLVVRLRPLSASQLGAVQREPLFDRPEIEVGFLVAGQDPALVEVSFPAGTDLAEAHSYLYAELQELPVQADGLAARWAEVGSTLRLELSPGETKVAVTLEPGLRHCLTARTPRGGQEDVTWASAALEFDLEQGWTRGRAERFVEERLGLRETGRTTLLSRCYRSRPALARVLSDLLFAGGYQGERERGTVLTDGLPAVEFIPVPAGFRPELHHHADMEPRWGGGGTALATRTRTVHGGAGLEVDLSDPRRPDALPAELRALLPAKGVVNYTEARAVVQALEERVADPVFLSAGADGKVERGESCQSAGGREGGLRPGERCCEAFCGHGGPAVAVISPFTAQVELLRVLISRSAVLAKSGVAIEVGLPSSLAQRECQVGVVSLTRSHRSRAVPFSEDPGDLILALTRPVSRLLVFGDPGTLQRRSQWFGSLDHLDETTGPKEQALITRLLTLLPEQEGQELPSRAAAGIPCSRTLT